MKLLKTTTSVFLAIASTLPRKIAPYFSQNFHSTKLTHLLRHQKSNKYNHQISQIIKLISFP
ncbi:hypothetical protein [Okeania sp. KiyG1]|uniref:hypothetical protein n=1 Tax=Okeania sp. KiyG1 TaxID=2720165 RepID=UPI001922960F|nr:hypothetical protein [Okeania sp. KiyG1]